MSFREITPEAEKGSEVEAEGSLGSTRPFGPKEVRT